MEIWFIVKIFSVFKPKLEDSIFKLDCSELGIKILFLLLFCVLKIVKLLLAMPLFVLLKEDTFNGDALELLSWLCDKATNPLSVENKLLLLAIKLLFILFEIERVFKILF